MNFEFDKDGYLLVDDVYYDPRFSPIFIRIGGQYYKLMKTDCYATGRDFAKDLIPTNYQASPYIQPYFSPIMSMACKCRKRNGGGKHGRDEP